MNYDCDPTEQLARQDQLEALFEADGRHNKLHPYHQCYTGLMTPEQFGFRDQVLIAYARAYEAAIAEDGPSCHHAGIAAVVELVARRTLELEPAVALALVQQEFSQ